MDNTTLQKMSFENLGYARVWDPRHKIIFREVERIIRKEKYDKFSLIDYAAAGGEVLLDIKERHPETYCFGVDIIESAMENLKKHNMPGKLHDLENPLALDKKFDIALAGEVIEHLISPDNFLHSINRNLNDNGYLILTFPNTVHAISLFTQWILDLPPWTGARYRSFHVREYTYRLAKHLLRAHGFRIVKRLGSEIPYMPGWTRVFTRPFPRLGRNIIIIAKKMAPPNDEMIKNPGAISDISKLLKFLKSNKKWK